MPIHHRTDLLERARASRRRYHLAGIPPGPEGTRETLRIMARLAREYRRHPLVVELARYIIEEVPAKNAAAEVEAIREWVSYQVRYTEDITEVETLQTPEALLESLQGDCDDQATLVAALVNAIGKKARFRAIAFAPDEFAHVYTEVLLGPPQDPRSWVSAETTEDVHLGWQPPGIVASMIEHV